MVSVFETYDFYNINITKINTNIKGVNLEMNQLTHTKQIQWKLLNEEDSAGVWIKSLRFDSETKRSPTIILKFDPGARYPAHTHPAGEEIFVIEGTVQVGKDFLTAGDYLYTAPNNIHAVYSKNGCILLLSVPEQVIILEQA